MPYHISPDGHPRECSAQPGNCKFGGGTHYATETEALHAAVEHALSRPVSTVPPIEYEADLSSWGLGEVIRERTDLPPSELRRLARTYPKVEVLCAILKHPNVDSKTVATVMSKNTEDRAVANAAIFNPQISADLFPMIYDTHTGRDKEDLLQAMASRSELPDEITSRIFAGENPWPRSRYANNSKNPEHLRQLAKDKHPAVHVNAYGNVFTPKEVLEAALTEFPETDERREAAAGALSFIQRFGVKRDYSV